MGYKIYFGGTYKEHWTEDYTMSVTYEGRRWVIAEKERGMWRVTEGDSALAETLCRDDCPWLMKAYFNAAAQVYSALNEWGKQNRSFETLPEQVDFGNDPLSAPELMRILMDDCGFSLEKAFSVASRCCTDVTAAGVSTEEMLPIQPRTAHVISIMRRCAVGSIRLCHDSRLEKYRRPLGAVKTDDSVELSAELQRGSAENVSLCVSGDGFEAEYPAVCCGSTYTVTFKAPEKPVALWYCFKLISGGTVQYLCPDGSGFSGMMTEKKTSGFRLTVYDKNFTSPGWFKKAVMYQIYPDRFAFSADGTAEAGIAYHRALGQTAELHASLDEEVRYLPRNFEKHYIPDDFYGGTLKGIEGKLDYISSLGVNCIYLNPVSEARSNHRYDTSDYFRVDPVLGTNEDFEHLCRAAAERGIRIILDGVFSHTGADSVYFNRYDHYPDKGACQGKDSPYYSWYDFHHFPDDYRCWWGFTELPEVEETNPSWQDKIVTSDQSAVKLWLRRGASGWRLDVADELPDEVLSLIRKAAREEKPDAPIIGEVWEDPVIKESYGVHRNYALGYSLDSVMNYPLRQALLDYARGMINAADMRDFLTSQQLNYPAPMYYSLMNLLGSHDVPRLRSALATDTDIRSLSREDQLKLEFSPESLDHAVELEKLCAVVQFSLPGVPSVYYGDEQGMCGVSDPFNRRPFRKGDGELERFYASLGQLRRENDALSTGRAEFSSTEDGLLLIKRYILDGRDAFGDPAENGAFLTVVNAGNADAAYCVDMSLYGGETLSGTIGAHTAKIISVNAKKA